MAANTSAALSANTTADDLITIRTARLGTNAQGVYEVRFSEPIPPTNKYYRSRRISCRTEDAAQAERFLNEFKDLERERFYKLTRKSRMPAEGGPLDRNIEELCDRWEEHAERQGMHKTNRYSLVPVRRHLGHLPVSALNHQVLADYHTRRNRMAPSIRRELGALRTVLLWCARQKYIPRDAVPAFDLPPAGEPRSLFLDEADEQRLWDHAMALGQVTGPGYHAYAVAAAQRVMLFTALAMETAARRQAIYDLTWDRIDLDRRQIDFRVPGRRLSNKRRVPVPISDRLLPVLVEAARRAPQDRDTKRPRGRVMGEVGCIRRAFRDWAESIGMGWVTPHVLRHTWATLAARNGVSMWDIAGIMGDRVDTVTANYLHHSPDRLRNVVNHRKVLVAA